MTILRIGRTLLRGRRHAAKDYLRFAKYFYRGTLGRAYKHAHDLCDVDSCIAQSAWLRFLNNHRKGETMKKMLLKFLRDQKGLTTVEYAVAGALITLAVIGAFQALGGNVSAVITLIASYIQP